MISKTCVWHASCIRIGNARKAAPRADGAAFGTSLAYASLTYLSVYAVGMPRESQKTACGARLWIILAGKLEGKDYESPLKEWIISD